MSASALVLGFVIFQVFNIYHSAHQTLSNERARLIGQNRVPFEKRILTPHLSQKIQILQNTADVRDFIKFRDSFFAATGGGLLQMSEEGKILKHFTVLDGLPESDLTSLATFSGKLFIGMQTKNLVSFDGERFENYVWTDRKAQAVTSFLEDDGKLLIGTMNGGLLEFDGASFREIKAQAKKISTVNYLHKNETKLFVGTFDNGLWIYENDVWSHFTTTDGLPSNRVVSIAFKDKKLFVATDFGLAISDGKIFRTVAVLPSLSSLALHENRLFLTKANGEIFTYDDSLREFFIQKKLENSRLISDTKLWLLSNEGISEIQKAKPKPFGLTENLSLTDNFVSAMAFDHSGNFWVGTFRRGIDVFAAEGKKRTHLETENARQINYLRSNGESVSVATSAGLINFKSNFSAENLTKKDGLKSNSITHFSGEYIATAKGLAFRENDKFRVLSTAQGLPGNSIYTTLQIGKKLYAGTLNGLAEIENGRVARVFRDSNSNLTTNWVTALCYTGERIFIGTYGGGIFELMPSGEIRSFESDAGKFAVNPNAIFSDGERLYAGTLEGVKILDLQTQEWKNLKNILPAETVMSITGNEEKIYFGTTNGIAQIEKSYFAKGEKE